MNELIPITSAAIGGQLKSSVDGRWLHGELEVQSKYADWMPRRIADLDLAENVDFVVLKNENDGNTNKFKPVDYQLTLRAALQIAMREGTPPAADVRDRIIDRMERSMVEAELRLQALEAWMADQLKALEGKMAGQLAALEARMTAKVDVFSAKTLAEFKDLKSNVTARVNASELELRKAQRETGSRLDSCAAKVALLESSAGLAADAADWSKPYEEFDSEYGINLEMYLRQLEELDPKNMISLELKDLIKILVNEGWLTMIKGQPVTTLKAFKAGVMTNRTRACSKGIKPVPGLTDKGVEHLNKYFLALLGGR